MQKIKNKKNNFKKYILLKISFEIIWSIEKKYVLMKFFLRKNKV